MKRSCLFAGCISLLAATLVAGSGVRIRDLATVAGNRDNQLLGYGLVTGLAGDGDKDPAYTKQTLANTLQSFGVNIPPTALSAKNVAVVTVTADIRAFVKKGARLDVQISSLGDAKSLQGGILLQTPLYGADRNVYAVAQGAVAVGGFSAGVSGAGGANVTKNHPTVGTIVDGALVEREIRASVVNEQCVEFLLREPGFTTAARMATAINEVLPSSALAMDSTSVRVRLPDGLEGREVDFIARLEAIEINPETPARIIINERTGTIVATSRVRIANCAVAQGNLTISIASTLTASQPSAFSNTGTTAILPSTTTEVTEPKGALVSLPEMPTVEKVASALNRLGVTPRDMMAIFQAMKQAGALQAELLIR
jgi:flagellar P-ring protein precursor FlgI